MAIEMISEITGRSNQKDLILFDRGYPSVELLSFLIENNINFLMRSSRTYSKGNKIFKKIMNQISRSTVPVRQECQFKRNKKNKRGKISCIN